MVGETTIELGKNRIKEPDEIKMTRQKLWDAGKDFNNAIKNKQNDINEKLHKKMQIQGELREQLLANNKKRIKNQLDELIKLGPRSKEFWKALKRTIGGNKKEQYETMTEEFKFKFKFKMFILSFTNLCNR